LCLPRNTLYWQKLLLTSPTSGGHSVGVVRSRTKVTEFVYYHEWDRLCGLVVRVPGYRYGGPGFDSRILHEKKAVGLEQDPLGLVSATEELLGSNSSGSDLESREYGYRDSSR
jgi:hypothetical protein